MKKPIFPILLFLLTTLSISCTKETKITGTTLIGRLGAISDTLYLYGTDRFFDQLDTIYAEEGQFTHQIDVDTTIIAFIFSTRFQERPLFITPNNQITLQRDTTDSTRLLALGSKINTDYDLLQSKLTHTPDSLKDSLVTQFIIDHPFSMSSVFALQKHLAWQNKPNYKQIEDLIEKLPGILKDRQDIEEINTNIMRGQRAQEGRSALFFNVPSFNGKNFDKKDFNDKTYLLYFWATWDKQSKVLNDSLKKVYSKWKKQKNFEILGISLDTDTIAIQEVIKKDTLQWKIAYDTDGIESKVADRYGVMKLPTTYFINKHGTIIGRDLPIDSIQNLLDSTFKKNK